LESPSLFGVLFKHELFGKTASSPDQVLGRLFPDHAQIRATGRPKLSMLDQKIATAKFL
jgi:hypothetical protein